MAVYRFLHLKYWDDAFVSGLTQEATLVYLNLIANVKSTQCGIFELNLAGSAKHCKAKVENYLAAIEVFQKAGKVLYDPETSEIMMVSWPKYNYTTSKNTITCINKELKAVKNKTFLKVLYVICDELKMDVNAIFAGIDFEESTAKKFIMKMVNGTYDKSKYDHNLDKEFNKILFKNMPLSRNTNIDIAKNSTDVDYSQDYCGQTSAMREVETVPAVVTGVPEIATTVPAAVNGGCETVTTVTSGAKVAVESQIKMQEVGIKGAVAGKTTVIKSAEKAIVAGNEGYAVGQTASVAGARGIGVYGQDSTSNETFMGAQDLRGNNMLPTGQAISVGTIGFENERTGGHATAMASGLSTGSPVSIGYAGNNGQVLPENLYEVASTVDNQPQEFSRLKSILCCSPEDLQRYEKKCDFSEEAFKEFAAKGSGERPDIDDVTRCFDLNSPFKNVIESFNENIHLMRPLDFKSLYVWSKDISCEVVIKAIEESAHKNQRNLAYIEKTLEFWYSKWVRNLRGLKELKKRQMMA